MRFISTNDIITLIFEHSNSQCFAPYFILLNCGRNEENNHIMRRLVVYTAVCACFFCMRLFVSCGKGAETIEPVPDTPGEPITLTLTASLPETKTVLDLSNDVTRLLWTPKDELWVRSAKQEAETPGNLFTTSSSAISPGGRVADFNGTSLSSGPYVAVCPYSSVQEGSGNSEILFTLPGKQKYVADSYDPSCFISAGAWESGTSFTMVSLLGLLKLQFTGSLPVREIMVTDNTPSSKLWGTGSVSVSGDTIGDVTIFNHDVTRNQIVLEIDGGVTLSDEPSSFYVVAPDGSFAEGYTLALYDDTGNLINTVVNDSDCTVKKGCITDISAINPEPVRFSGGRGSESDPFLISNASDLVELSTLTNSSDAGKFTGAFYRQTADIDMEGETFVPIAQNSSFTGSYDAGGFSVRSLKIASVASMPAGFIAKAEGATLNDLTLADADIDSKYVYCGALIGHATSCTIENCTVSGQVRQYTSGLTVGADNAGFSGGLVGWMDSTTLKGCTLDGEATFYGKFSGGLVGYAKNSTIENCSVAKEHTVNVYYHWAGGLVGKAEGENTLIKSCSFEGNLTSVGYIVGGIVGQIMGGRVEQCVFGSYGKMGADKYYVGGIVGAAVPVYEIVVDHCANYGRVNGQYAVGAIVGYTGPMSGGLAVSGATKPVTISNCASIGVEITATGNNGGSNAYSLVSGLVGWISGSSVTTVKGCYSTPSLIQTISQGNRGALSGIIGYQNCSGSTVFENCYSTAVPTNVLNRGERVTDVSGDCFFGAIYARCTSATTVRNCFWDEAMPTIGHNDGRTSESGNQALATSQLSDGTLLSKLQAGANGTVWIKGENGLPTIEGLPADPNVKPRAARRLSLIGDSISTFKGWIPAGYSNHYPAVDGSLTLVNETYWYRLVYDYMKDCEFDTNISFSGTAVTRTTEENYAARYGTATNTWYKKDFITRFIECGGLGRPDIILIHGGTNDWAHRADPLAPGVEIRNDASNIYGGTKPLAEIMNSIYAVADAAKTRSAIYALPDGTFCEAYVKLLCMIKERYPQAKVVCIIGDCLSQSIEQSILDIAGHYAAKTVNLFRVNGFNDLGGYSPSTLSNKGRQPNMPKHDYNGDAGGYHPDSRGMNFIAEKIYNELGTWLEE